jgi:hypothetical protein
MTVDTRARGSHDEPMVGDVGNPETEERSPATKARDSMGRRIGRRTGLAVVIAIALAFTAASAVQILSGALESNVRPLPQAPPGSAARLCADGVRSLALDPMAMVRANTWGSPEAAKFALESEAVASPCARSSEGLDAWASLRRFAEAARQLPADRRDELTTLRRNVFAHLPVELR